MKSLMIWTLILVFGACPFLIWAQNDSGLASVYSDSFSGKMTASGEKYDPNAFTAAHKLLRFGTRLAVTNPANGRTVTVRIDDRGPWVDNRILDLSKAAAQALGISGVGNVSVRVLRADQADVTYLPVKAPKTDPTTFVPTLGSVAYFQLGAFRVESSARSLARSLIKQGYSPSVQQTDSLFRVFVTTPQTDVHALLDRLAKDGHQSYFQVSKAPMGTELTLASNP